MLGSRCFYHSLPALVRIWKIAPYAGKGTGEKSLFRRMYDTLKPGDVVLADALFDDYFIVWELRKRKIDIVTRVQHDRVGSRIEESGPEGDILVWQRPNKPRGMTGEKYRSYPTSFAMRQVTVDARDKDNRAKQFKIVTTILDTSPNYQQIANDGRRLSASHYERSPFLPSEKHHNRQQNHIRSTLRSIRTATNASSREHSPASPRWAESPAVDYAPFTKYFNLKLVPFVGATDAVWRIFAARAGSNRQLALVSADQGHALGREA